MECNQEEARKAIEIAERKLSENDHNGAQRFARKAKTLYPNLDGLEQISTMIDVYVSASDKTSGSESNWYGILAVDQLADEEVIKKQYKKLALLLHPDKNRFNGAEGAFKLVLDAWSLLSDKAKRVAYDHKRKRKEKKSERKPPTPPASDASANRENQKRARQETADKAKEESSSKKKKARCSCECTFWTLCTHCTTEYLRDYYLNGKPYMRIRPPITITPKPASNKRKHK